MHHENIMHRVAYTGIKRDTQRQLAQPMLQESPCHASAVAATKPRVYNGRTAPARPALECLTFWNELESTPALAEGGCESVQRCDPYTTTKIASRTLLPRSHGRSSEEQVSRAFGRPCQFTPTAAAKYQGLSATFLFQMCQSARIANLRRTERREVRRVQ